MSLLLFALTPPAEWKSSGRMIVDAARPELERLLAGQKINSGAKEARKVASEGVAVGFVHYESFAGMPHGHFHGAVPNVSVGADGKVGSIANAKDAYDAQGLMRASFHKGLDEALQLRGYRTARAGKTVDVVGIPAEMVAAFSPAWAAMNAAREKAGYVGARAADFFARPARRKRPRSGTPSGSGPPSGSA